ncbi:MAG: Acylase ACY 1 [Alphaproteobacteria bacterium MarineAlpha10_Bin3]|jgi:gamma-glutamyltranspeptidase/glutathione hydrolase|nr:MAG: Acylase ACY 1 [Alphaproteobacteria bacterium MarineAlpha10_Bin3]PPR75481.1 MAG: Acylase ACY 1 [Alphaproteobacteria bacterium MarineAlpha4_Bin1]
MNELNTNFYQNWQLRKPAVRGGGGVVSSHFRTAAQAGAEVLRAGGNAVDAAIATSFAVSVVEPWMSGLGGCGYMLIYLAQEDRVRCIDFGAVAPAALDPSDYPLVEGEGGDIFTWPAVRDDANVHGYRSMATPGQLDGVGLAWERYGTKPWADLLAPAITLAERGLPVNWMTTIRVASAMVDLRRYAASAQIYLPDARPPLPDVGKPVPHLPLGGMANTLKRLAQAGHRDLYEGEVAARIIADIEAGGGSLRAADLAQYRAREVDPLMRDYGPARVFAAPGLTAGPTLFRVLDAIGGKIGAGTPGPAAYAQWARAMSDAYAERFRTMGAEDDSRAPGSTTHLCVIDADGNMVTLTQTLLSVFGSKTVLPQTGILMNNGILWFDPVPGKPNSMAPSKRPLSNMCPMLATRDGKPWFALGASGGRRIMPAVMQVASMLIDGAMDFEDAFHQPRIDVSGDGRATLDMRLDDGVVAAIEAHMPVFREEQSVYPNAFAKPNGVMRDPDTGAFLGVGDIMNPVAGAVGA